MSGEPIEQNRPLLVLLLLVVDAMIERDARMRDANEGCGWGWGGHGWREIPENI